jgi:hypothetical protein
MEVFQISILFGLLFIILYKEGNLDLDKISSAAILAETA